MEPVIATRLLPELGVHVMLLPVMLAVPSPAPSDPTRASRFIWSPSSSVLLAGTTRTVTGWLRT
jgi:hypothetical protein